MTILEAITRTDDLKPNSYSQEQKVRWLSQLDGMIKTQIIDTHEGADNVIFAGYDENTPKETVLLAPAPFDSMYILWLKAQIDYNNEESKKYNNDMETFETEYSAFRNCYNRCHMPVGQPIRFT